MAVHRTRDHTVFCDDSFICHFVDSGVLCTNLQKLRVLLLAAISNCGIPEGEQENLMVSLTPFAEFPETDPVDLDSEGNLPPIPPVLGFFS